LILVDTSIWIDHLRAEDPHWTSLLADGEVLVHPMVIGELACGNLRHREQVIMDLQDLLASPVATNDEALLFPQRLSIDGTRNRFHRHHLLAATALASTALLWTADRRLLNAATELGLDYSPSDRN
jgi:predicted nucleic acid-binding protein